MTREPAERLLLGVLGIVLLLAGWQLVGLEGWAGSSWPPLSRVLPVLLSPAHRALFGRALRASLSAVALGYAAGLLSGLLAAMLGHVLRPLRPGLDTLANLLHAIPIIALAPLLIALMSRSWTGTAIAALGTFYVVYVSASSGLEATLAAHADLFRAFGSGARTRLVWLDLPAAAPSIAAGMKYAVPIAFVGAILGEWFGSAHGIGLLIVGAMQNFQIPLLWSAVLLASVPSVLAYGLLAALERAVAARCR